MRILSGAKEISSFLARLQSRTFGGDTSAEESVRKIVEDVRARGDESVLEYTRLYDYTAAKSIKLRRSEIAAAARKADAAIVSALRASAGRIRKFHERQRESSWSFMDRENILGQIIRPLRRVGIYVPGGKAAYPSTVLMNAIPAQVAGVREIAVCVPSPGGYLNPYVMAALELLGLREVYAIGGAQAVAAMAFGTGAVKKVDKIVGPGNIFVAAAKKLVFGVVDIDMIAGPSEILVIADAHADPDFIAADLLSQAEHDEMASSILVTESRSLALRVAEETERQLAALKRREIARRALDDYGALIVTRSLADAAGIANRIAPEHLEIQTASPVEILPMIENAGAVFLGPWTPEALGDYSAGPNHTLPTGGSARFFSPLGVYDFYKRSSLLGFSKRGFSGLSKTVQAIAEIEGLEGHANSIRIRKGRLLSAKKSK